MIKQTFLNLTDSKKQKIVDAAKIEFSNYSIHEASINRIIKYLNISRGSFYTYFDTIEDLYFYILKDFRNEMTSNILEQLKINNGDIFQAILNCFDFITNDNYNKIDAGILEKLFFNFSLRNEKFIKTNQFSEEINVLIDEIYSTLDTKKLKISNKKEFLLLLEMLVDSMFKHLVLYFLNKDNKPEIKNKFIFKLDIIKHGIIKEDKDV